MKVLNLQCVQSHAFEGWFASEDDFQSQLLRELIECPLCSSKSIEKMPSAPRLNFGAQPTASGDSSAPAHVTGMGTAAQRAVDPPATSSQAEASTSLMTGEQADFLKALRHLVANTEDVGPRFADEARGMHYGDIEKRSIRGQASPREALELMEEGIDVMPLPIPAALKATLQ
jgi:hypothetical protein